MRCAVSTWPGVTRKSFSPSGLNGSCSRRWTPAVVTSATVVSLKGRRFGVYGMQRRDIAMLPIPSGGRLPAARPQRRATGRGRPSAPAPLCLSELAQHVEDHLGVRLLVELVDVDVGDLALLVDHHDGPRGDATVFHQRAVGARHPAVRPEVAEEGIGDAAQRVRPRGVAGNVVYAYAQDLGVEALEARLKRLVLGHLDASDRRPGGGVERD